MFLSNRYSQRINSPWFVLIVVSLPVFIGALDLTIISAVLPDVIIGLELPVKEYLDQASWAVNGYLLAYAISMTFTGRLSDLFGRRAIYIACLVIFMIGSYLVTAYDSALLNSWLSRFYRQVLGLHPPRQAERYLYLVIVGRVVQAFGAGAMVPVTIALVGDLFLPHERAKPLGVVGAVDTMGWVLGHLYGGVMVRLFGEYGSQIVDVFKSVGVAVATPSWETLFILNIPISLLALLGAWWVLRNVQQPRSTGRFDLLGTLCITLALIGLNLGLGQSRIGQFGSSIEDLKNTATGYGPYFLTGAAVAFVGFILIESRVKYPLLRLAMFRGRNLSAASLANLLVGFCLAIGLVSAPLLVNFRMKEATNAGIQNAALIAGLLLSGLTVPMAMAAIPGGWLSDRYGYRVPTVLGLGLASAGFAMTGLLWRSNTPYAIMGAQMAVIGIGLGLTISPIGTAALNDVDEHERGVASALILMLRLVGMTVAISWLTVYSLDRFDTLQARYAVTTVTNLEDMLLATQRANQRAVVDVVSELQLVGAVVSGIALVFALFLHGGRSHPARADAQPSAAR
jgi:MFS family permease